MNLFIFNYIHENKDSRSFSYSPNYDFFYELTDCALFRIWFSTQAGSQAQRIQPGIPEGSQ